ncbi:hypothetical protein R1sor_023459 [Riccia sorocarpa]|uniref:Uncharacterized protein n=1 Tax=Riccia sorocarpa TaxID=122646 RepID=A0ABD3GMU1_9MARC
MSSSSVKPFRTADIFINVSVKKSKSKWFIREALHVFGARSIFLQSSKKDPVNTGFIVHIGQEKDQVDVLVQTEKELVCYELLRKNIQIREFSVPLQKILGPEINVDALGEHFVADPRWKFVERDSVKLVLRLSIQKPPQGCKAQDMLPHNKEWDAYKAREEARLKAQESARADEAIEEDVEEDPASKVVSPEVDRAKTKRNDGSSQRESVLSIPKPPASSRRPRSSAPSSSQATTSQPSESQGVPQYLVQENTPVDETDALARMELLAQYPGIYTHYRHCNCILYAGLSKTEASLFAHDDNFDAEVRRKYTFHQRVEYFHRQFMEAKQTGEPMAVLRKRLALETMNIGEEDSKTALSTLEGTFQVAFRTGRLWEVQESIFRKWERKELKSMKSSAKAKKKDDDEMRQTWWRPLQGVSDERKLSILLRVDAGELSLDQMTQECARCKTLDKDRSCSNSITKALYGVDELEPEGGKRKRASKAKSLVQVLPPEFLDHIDSARAYKEAKESGRLVPVPEQTFKH